MAHSLLHPHLFLASLIKLVVISLAVTTLLGSAACGGEPDNKAEKALTAYERCIDRADTQAQLDDCDGLRDAALQAPLD